MLFIVLILLLALTRAQLETGPSAGSAPYMSLIDDTVRLVSIANANDKFPGADGQDCEKLLFANFAALHFTVYGFVYTDQLVGVLDGLGVHVDPSNSSQFIVSVL
jgi:hypothetical protein